MKRILIVGGSGFVGGNIASLARMQSWDVVVADRIQKEGLGSIPWRQIDITDADSVTTLVEDVRPDAVVNVAAMADVDAAEADQQTAWKINVEGPENIARACSVVGARYVFFSSDAVYDGLGSGYTESDSPDPVNFYGRTKAEAEKCVRAACPEAVIIRISLVLGYPVTSGNSFVAALDEKLASGREVLCPTEEVRTPVDVRTLSESVLELAEGDFSGILHIGCTESVDRYHLTKKLATKMGYGADKIRPRTDAAPQPGRAPRHKNGIIDVTRAGEVLKTPMRSLEATIQRVFDDKTLPTTD